MLITTFDMNDEQTKKVFIRSNSFIRALAATECLRRTGHERQKGGLYFTLHLS